MLFSVPAGESNSGVCMGVSRGVCMIVLPISVCRTNKGGDFRVYGHIKVLTQIKLAVCRTVLENVAQKDAHPGREISVKLGGNGLHFQKSY